MSLMLGLMLLFSWKYLIFHLKEKEDLPSEHIRWD